MTFIKKILGQKSKKKFWKKIDPKPTFSIYQNTYNKRVLL